MTVGHAVGLRGFVGGHVIHIHIRIDFIVSVVGEEIIAHGPRHFLADALAMDVFAQMVSDLWPPRFIDELH